MALAAASLALPVPVRAITCSTTKIVKQAGGGDCTTIQSCVNGIPTPLVGDYCIDVQDNATYAEQVTVRNIANAGYQIVIGSSTANFRPALNPPGASAAAFLIANASVTIFNLDVKPANVITYGVQISSAYVTISSVNIQDAGGKINTAGIYVSSWNTVSYTSVTVNAAHGFWLPGSTMTAISYSSAVNNSTTQHAFYLNGASSNTFTAVLASNTAAGRAMSLDKSANYNTISLSTMSGPGASGGVYLNTASSNTFTGSYFDGRQNRALYFDSGATYNTVSRSTTTFNTGGSTYGIWFNDNNVSYNTITQSWLFSDSRNVLFNSGAHHNTISLSTVSNSGGSGSDSAVFFSGTNTSSNTVTQSYLWGATGTGVKFDSGASYNTVSQSTVANNSSFSPDYTVLFQGGSGSQRAKYNTVSGSFIASYNASGKGVLFNGTGNTLTLSTVTALAAGLGAVYASNTSSSTISQSYIYNSAGYGLWLDAGSSYTAVSQSTVAGGAAGQAALYVSGSSGNVLTQSLIWNLSGPAALFTGVGASLNTVSFSTMNGTNSYGLFLDKTSSNTIWNSHVQGSTAAIVSGSTGATINASVLVGTNTSGSGVWVSSGVNLFISSNTITGGTNGAGAYLDINNRGLLTLSTNTINAGPQYGLYVATQAAGTALWVTSNTIVPTVTSARNTYGIYLNGLTSGATIQNNAVVYRTSGSMGVNSTWALYAQSVSGLNVDHNRFSNPGTITGGVYNGVAFSGAANTAFKFNDVNSTGTGLTNAYLLQLSVSSVTIKNNVFLASMTVTGSSASLTADAASGFNGANGSNYNDWYSSNTANTFIWGGQAYAFSNGWTGQDANSIASNPLWFNPVGGVEDFHPKSVQGRYNPATQAFVPDGATSATVDAGDPTEAYALEPSPNGSRANMGSYGNTAQASESNVAGCSTQLTVSQANGPYTTIQGAVNAIPASLTGYTCVVIQDGATYAEQVTVQGFTNNGSSITIRADPATGLTPAVNPPANSTAAFHILQGSVNVIGINIAPSNAVTYGIQASSNWVTISSVNVQDAGGKISLAGIALSSSSAVLSYSSVTVTTAHGLRVAGNWNTVFESSAQANSASLYALYLQAASSNTFTVFFASNSAGWVVDLDGSSTQNSLSSMTAFGLSGVGGTANTVAKSYLYGTNIALDFSGTLNTISLSTITGNINSYAAYGNVGSSVALTQDYIYNAGTGYGLYLNTNIGYTTISQSTITSGGGPAVFLGHNGGTFGHTTISGSFISGLGGQGIAVNGSSPYNTIRQSTITGTNHALGIVSSSTTIVDCYLQASTAVYISGSTGTVIGGSVLVGTNTTGSGVWLAGGSVNLTLTSNTITGGTNGSGVLLDANNSGLIILSTNTITAGARVGLNIATQAANAAIWVTSNTIVPTVTSARNTYGVYLNGLTSGATIQNNAVVYRTSGSMGVNSTWALYAQSVSGLNIDHNRFSNPGMITGGVSNGVAFSGAANTAFKFNDVHSTGTALASAYLLQLAASTVTIKNNVFLSSFVVTGSSASLSLDAASGLGGANGSNYNDWYSSTSFNAMTWGSATAQFSGGWLGQDSNSIASNPLWFNPVGGAEDFHPKSQGGRYNPATQTFAADAAAAGTIDTGDPAEGYSLEPAPNGSRVNMGSYGNTAQASESSAAGCSTTRTVHQTNGPYTTIQAAVNAIPASLTGYTCVQIEDGATYAEQVTVQGFTNNGSSITIRADPATGLTPAVNPPANSTAAFHILQASVNVLGINIAPANGVTYGVQASSAYITISSVNVLDAGGKISLAGVSISSWGTVSYSSVTVVAAHGFWLPGSTMTNISYSSAVNNSASFNAVFVNGASSNTFTVVTATNSAGHGVLLNAGATYNTISRSTCASAAVPASHGLALSGASYNTVTGSYLSGYTGRGAKLSSSDNNTISKSTLTNSGGWALWFLASSSNTISQSWISNGVLIQQDTSKYNVVSQSTMTGGVGGIQIEAGSSNTVTNCYIQGTAPLTVIGATGTVVSASVLFNAAGYGVYAYNGSVNLTVSSSTITGGPQAAGIRLGAGSTGLIILSTNTIQGAQYGVLIPTQTAQAAIWITSNTIVPAVTSVNDTYGIYLNGLTSGATIQNNAIVWRDSGSQSGRTAYGLFAQTVSGLNIDHNRISLPGLLTAGSFTGAYFAGASGTQFVYNDVSSTGTAFTNAYLLQLAVSTVTIKDNIFLSSMAVTGSSASLTADAASGFNGVNGSDYNDWYSSNTANTLVWGGQAYAFSNGWANQDAHSIAANPLWFNPVGGVEDFHPKSVEGRYNPATQTFVPDGATSTTVDAGDPSEAFSLEPSPNGSRANMGSYGNTDQASKSNLAGCSTQLTVSQANGPYTTIQGAVNAIPASLTGHTCVVIQDGATYAEQVTVQGFTNNGSSITIRADPDGGLTPTVNPPANSTAAFHILQASVNVIGINVAPATSVTFGVKASSSYVTISSVNVLDAGGKIWNTGLSVVGYSTISYSSVTVTTAHGFQTTGNGNSISYSSAQAGSASLYALYVNGGSTNTFSVVTASNPAGTSLYLNSNYNNADHLTAVGRDITVTGQYTTLTQSSFSALGGTFDFEGTRNTLSQSTVTGNTTYALYVNNASSLSITGVLITGSGLYVNTNGHYGTVSQSTITSGVKNGVQIGTGHHWTIERSFIYAASGGTRGLYLFNGTYGNTVSRSTITAGTGTAIYLGGAPVSSNTITASYIQGSTAVHMNGSTGTVITSSVLVATNTTGSGVWLAGGSVNLTLTSNTITGGTNGSGVLLDANNSGLIILSTNTITAGARVGLNIATQAANAAIWVTSNTIVPTVTTANDTYGIYLNGLTSGATIQNNAVVWRNSGSQSGKTAYGLYGQSVSGLNIDHNRISLPGLLTAGSFTGAYFAGVQQTDFKFNDINSTGTSFTNAYLLQLAASTVTIKNNVFLSSFAVTGSSASLSLDATSGLGGANGSDYNDWYSSTSFNAMTWGSATAQFSGGWLGQDANSIASNPLWFNPVGGAEDFHPLSPQGRYDPATQAFVQDAATSSTIDAGDPAEAYSLEPAPNGSRVNMGSYGNTAQASEAAFPAPTLANPSNGAGVSTSTPSMTWSTNTAGNHRLQLSQDSAFTQVIADSTTANAYYTSTNTLTNAAIYWWRVAAAAGLNWSNAYSFTVDLGSPAFTTPQVSTSSTGPWTSLPAASTYMSSNVVSVRVTVQDPVSGLLVSTGLPTGLVGQWHFDESSGPAALDASTNSLNGTLVPSSMTWVAGRRGSALSFDGSVNYVNLGTPANLNFGSGDFTYSAWIKTTASGTNNCISQDQDVIPAQRTLRLNAGKAQFVCRDASSNTMNITSGRTINDNAWHHIAGIRQGSSVSLYVDGILEIATSNASVGSCDGSTSTYVGARPYGGGSGYFPFNGQIDEVRIYNVARSSMQVLAEYESDTLAAHNRSAAFNVLYSTNGGASWNYVSTNSVTLGGSNGVTTAQTLLASNISLVTSTGASAVNNQVAVVASDYAGNVSTAVYTVLVDTTSTAPIPGSPSNTFAVSTSTPVMFWSTATAGNSRLQLAQDESITQIVADSTTANTYYVSTNTLSNGTTYWWRVSQNQPIGGAPMWSSTFSFTVDLGSPTFTAAQVSTSSTGPWTNLPSGSTYMSSTVVSVRVTVQDPVSGLLVSTGLPTGLVGQWHLDEGSGTVALDASTNSWTGTLVNGPVWGAGKRGGGLVLNGSSQYVQTGLAPSGFAGLTMEAWVKLEATGTTYPMIFSYGSNADNVLELRGFTTTGQIEVVRRSDNAGIRDAVNSAGTGWHHWAVTSDGTTFKLYKDGVLLGSSNLAHGLNSTTSLRLGRRSNDEGGVFVFGGTIDEARVFNVVRSSAQILADYQADTVTAHNRSAAFNVLYSTNAGATWTAVSTNSVTLGGSNGLTTAQTLLASDIVLVMSTGTGALTNQVAFVVSDYAGNVSTSVYTILVDTTANFASVAGCATTLNVKKNSPSSYSTIQAAVNAIASPLTAHTCVVVRDGSTYAEQVTVQGFTNNGSSITIRSDPATGLTPVIDPPAPGAFSILQASVNVIGLNIVPTGSIDYGIQASSSYVTISSVNVIDPTGKISLQGVSLSSWSALSYSSITVTLAHGILLTGSTMTTISYSTAVNNSGAFPALLLNGASSNTMTRSFFSNAGGMGVSINNSGSYNVLSYSTASASGSEAALSITLGSSSNTVTQSYLQNLFGRAALYDYATRYNVMTVSTLTANTVGNPAFQIRGSSYNTISQAFIQNLTASGEDGLQIRDGSIYNTVSQTTVTVNNANGNALHLQVDAASNTITQSYLANASGKAANFNAGVNYNTLSLSTAVSNAAGQAAFLFNGSSYNVVTQSILKNTGGSHAILLNAGSKGNTVSLSTATAAAANNNALTISGTGPASNPISSNTFTRSYFYNSLGRAIRFSTFGEGNSVTQSTAASDAVSAAAVGLSAASTTISGCLIQAPGGAAGLSVDGGALYTTVSLSTITGASSGSSALFVTNSSTTRVWNSYIQGSTAATVASSTGTQINASTLVGLNASGSGAWISTGNVGATVSSSTLTGGASGAGVWLEAGNAAGTYILSTNTVNAGGRYGVYIATQTPGASLWVTSNTIVPTVSGVSNTYGIYINGLTSGATIENNLVAYRNSGSMGVNSTWALYAQSTAELVIRRNRFNQPGMITGGTYNGIEFNASDPQFTFNDVNSTGTGLTNAYLLKLSNNSIADILKNNVFLSSVSVTGSSATLVVDATSDLTSDYNDWYSSNSFNTAILNGVSYQFLGGWRTASGKDANSIAVNPLWFNVTGGVEDFHPKSQAGRYDPATETFTQDAATSATLDKGDPLEAYSLEPAPNGSQVNLGSYGNTAQASKSVASATPPSLYFVGVSSIGVQYATLEGASGYVVEASTKSDFTGTVVSSSVAGTQSLLAPFGLQPNTTYYLRAGTLWSQTTSYNDTTLSTATLAQLVSGTTVYQIHVTSMIVNWIPRALSPPDASSNSASGYLLQVSTRSDFTPLWTTSSTTNVGLSTLTVSGLEGGTTYFFRVGSLNVDNAASFAAYVSTLMPVQLGVSLTTHTVSLPGLTDLNSTVVVTTSIVVTNTGNVTETYSLRATTVTSGSPWTIGTTQAQDRYVMWAVVNSTQPAAPDFNTSSKLADGYQACGAAAFTMGNQTCVQVPIGGTRTLWVQLATPLVTSTGSAQDIQITAQAVKDP